MMIQTLNLISAVPGNFYHDESTFKGKCRGYYTMVIKNGYSHTVEMKWRIQQLNIL